MIGTNWVLDGKRVRASYLGVEVKGVILDSRVKYGGRIGYTLRLDAPTQFKWSTEPTDKVLIENSQLLEIFPDPAAR